MLSNKKTLSLEQLFQVLRDWNKYDESLRTVSPEEQFPQTVNEAFTDSNGNPITMTTERMLNYLSYWFAARESIMASHRVKAAFEMMTEQGLYHGGGVPYGYKLIRSGRFNYRGKELMKMVVDEDESAVVKLIFNWMDYETIAPKLLAVWLNTHGVSTRKGGLWSAKTIRTLLRNPIYMGYMTLHRGTDREVRSTQANPEITLISEQQWNRINADNG